MSQAAAEEGSAAAPAPRRALPASKTVRPLGPNCGTATFPIGSHVRTKATKHKAMYDNQRGEVVALLNKKARIKLMTGTCAGGSMLSDSVM